jgi:hypothetical protein
MTRVGTADTASSDVESPGRSQTSAGASLFADLPAPRYDPGMSLRPAYLRSRRRYPKPGRRRALEATRLLPDGCIEAMMLAQGFTTSWHRDDRSSDGR